MVTIFGAMMLQVHFVGLLLTASSAFGSVALHWHVTSTAVIFDTVMRQAHFVGLALTASVAFGSPPLPWRTLGEYAGGKPTGCPTTASNV